MLKGYRTVIFNVIMAGVAILSATGFVGDIPLPTEDQVGQAVDAVDVAITAVWAIGNVFLRAITNTSLGSKT